MDTKDKLVTLEDLKVVHDGVDALETRMESAESEISDTVKKSTGGTFNGDVAVDKADGTTSTQGWSSVSIGNNKATGTEGNSGGDLQIYGRTSYKTEFISPPNSPTANRVITIPDATGTLALTSDIQIRTVTVNFSVSASGQFNTNLYTVINNDLPSGKRCLGIVGFSTNNQAIVPVAIFYGNSSWSFQVRNLYSSALNDQHADIYYLASS